MKKVALFIPCFIDSIYPNVALATQKILTDLGFDVSYPTDQTCCGQPLYNSGFKDEAKELADRFYEIFKDYDYIVAPSASCISMVKVHYKDLLDLKKFEELSKKSFEICEFLHDEVKLKNLEVSFPHSISLHRSCHGLRELNLSTASELNLPYQDKVTNLLKQVKDIEILPMKMDEECCGFGGTFSINEPQLSISMAKDKIENFKDSKADYFVGYDNSCMMHLKSVSDYDKSKIRYLHVVEILAGMAI
jgi:L-lactate dehydrogenase complex protein LldE